MLHTRKVVSKKEDFVLSVHHAVVAKKHKPKYKQVTSGVTVLKQ